jgi:hypothetical protein
MFMFTGLSLCSKWRSWRVTGEDKIARWHGLVAGRTSFAHRRIGRFAVAKLRGSPAAGWGVLSRALNIHEARTYGVPATKRQGTAKGFALSNLHLASAFTC